MIKKNSSHSSIPSSKSNYSYNGISKFSLKPFYSCVLKIINLTIIFCLVSSNFLVSSEFAQAASTKVEEDANDYNQLVSPPAYSISGNPNNNGSIFVKQIKRLSSSRRNTISLINSNSSESNQENDNNVQFTPGYKWLECTLATGGTCPTSGETLTVNVQNKSWIQFGVVCKMYDSYGNVVNCDDNYTIYGSFNIGAWWWTWYDRGLQSDLWLKTNIHGDGDSPYIPPAIPCGKIVQGIFCRFCLLSNPLNLYNRVSGCG